MHFEYTYESANVCAISQRNSFRTSAAAAGAAAAAAAGRRANATVANVDALLCQRPHSHRPTLPMLHTHRVRPSKDVA